MEQESEHVRWARGRLERLLASGSYPYSRSTLGRVLIRLAELENDEAANRLIAELKITSYYRTVTSVAQLRTIRSAKGRGWHGPSGSHPGPIMNCQICRRAT